MRRPLLIAALLASHGAALWLGRSSPVESSPTNPAPGVPACPKKPAASGLAAVLRSAEQREEDAPAEAEVEQDEDALLAAAKAAIPAGTDLVAMVKAGAADPDLEVSLETRAAFSLWVDRDPIAALRWLVVWERDARYSHDLEDEFSRHFDGGGVAQVGLYLREVPAAADFLLGRVRRLNELTEPEATFRLAGTLDSQEDRLTVLVDRFESPGQTRGLLKQIRVLLDDRAAARFLSEISVTSLSPEDVAELQASGFPPHAIAQFLAEHPAKPEEGGLGADLAALNVSPLTNADFIGTLPSGLIPGVPEATGTNVTDIVTSGLRSGDGLINRNNIDAVLNNPNRTAQIPTAERIRGIFDSGTEKIGSISSPGSSMSWFAFSDWELWGVPGYEESKEAFLRGKITGEEWVNRLQQEIPGSADLRDELTVLVFRSSVGSDPRRAMNLLDESMPHQGLIMDLQQVAPEVLLRIANRFSADGELPKAVRRPLGSYMKQWAEEDPEAYVAGMADLSVGPVRDFLTKLQAEEEGSR